MSAELRCTKIEGVFELLSHPFVDSREHFLMLLGLMSKSFWKLGALVTSHK